MPRLNRGLSVKQEAFAREYIRNGGNGGKAAKDAGYKAKDANTYQSIATENLRKPAIKAFIDAEMQKINSSKICGEKEAMEIVSRIARGEANAEGKTPHESVRLKAADMILRINGSYAAEKVEVTGDIDVAAVLVKRKGRIDSAKQE
jgi:phage terminase small subunit